MTRAASDRIEAGQNRPNPSTLEQMARATGKRLSLFKDDDGGPGEPTGNPKRRLVSPTEREAPIAGRDEEVLSQGADSLEQVSDIVERGEAQLLIAEGLLTSGDRVGAVTWAREARATYLAIPQSPGAARCLLIEGRACRLARDTAAELFFRDALRECQALSPVPSLLEAEIACDLILHLSEESRWAAARSVYNQVRPSQELAPPLTAAWVNDGTEGHTSRANDRTRAQRSEGRVMAFYELAQCQAQVAIMAAELCLNPLRRGDDVASASFPEET